MTALPPAIHTWMASGRFLRVDDVSLYYQQHGSGPDLVCLHGFPTSSWDWHRVLPALSQQYRVTIFDFPGYGVSGKPADRSYSILRQMDTVTGLLGELGIGRCHLLSHDMGDTVACEWLYRMRQGEEAPEIEKLVMLNGGLYPDIHQPLLTQRMLRTPILGEITARLSSRQVFMHQYPKVYAQPESFSQEHYESQWALLLHNNGRRTLAKVACYMRERLKYNNRWLDSLHQSHLPIHLVWGRMDPIAVHAIAERLLHLRPATSLLTLPDAGHYPQLEAPGMVTSSVLQFLESG